MWSLQFKRIPAKRGQVKKVSFNLDNNMYFETYSSEEYDRSQIDHAVYLRSYNRMTSEEFNKINVLLDLYKLYEMPVHKESFNNNYYRLK